MYRNKKNMKKSIKTNVFEHDIVLASKKEKIPPPKDIFIMHNIPQKNKKKVKKQKRKRK